MKHQKSDQTISIQTHIQAIPDPSYSSIYKSRGTIEQKNLLSTTAEKAELVRMSYFPF